MSNIIVFDLDGVITSEEAYWDTAGLVIHELLYSPRYWNVGQASEYVPARSVAESRRASRQILPADVIADFKARAVNSNWDTCYCGFCLYLITLLARLPDCSALLPLRPEQVDWNAAFRRALALLPDERKCIDPESFHIFARPPFQNAIGLELIARFNGYASELLGQRIENVFGHNSPSWLFCQNLFQEWYLGDELYTQSYGHPPSQAGKPGCLHFEQPLLPVERMRAALEELRAQDYVLGVATGRPGVEGIAPIKTYGLYPYFDERRVVTYAEVELAEVELRAQGHATSLIKPHPYQFLRAENPDYHPEQSSLPRASFVVVGDTPSDMIGGRAAGALTVAVRTGSRTPDALTLLEQSQPDFIVDDMTQVPALLARIDDLATIQRLQFTDLAKAEMLLSRWFARHMRLQTDSVTLTPKAVSLNSFNGIYTIHGEAYFFKTHVEEQGVLAEYYHAELLHNAGYAIVRPLHTLHEQGRQMVVYPVIHDPVMFDLARAVETGKKTFATVEMLAAAEKRECEHLLAIYQKTLRQSSAEEHAQAPIHQLFWHRLTGGRLDGFYTGKQVPLPDSEQSTPFDELLRYRWSINGAQERDTLGELIERAKLVLNPARPAVTVIGHGDAHFGNVFLEQRRNYRYFDPAFAGRHSVLLDMVKPLFHNVFATWMYFPDDVMQDLHVSVALRDGQVCIEHDYKLSPLRQALLQTKLDFLLQPLKTLLREQDALQDDWYDVMTLALMCCPLLTINLLDRQRIPPTICWLGLSQVMQMGSLFLGG